MGTFPPYHIERPRLSARCADAKVVVAEAGAGYGKSVFGVELVDSWHMVPVELMLLGTGVSASAFASRLQYAIQRAGFQEAAGAVAAAGDDPQATVDAALEALEVESCAFVIDDAHNAERACGELIAYLAQHLRAQERCVVLARHLPDGAERLRRAEFLQVGAGDLALEPSETLRLCRSGFGMEVEPGDASAVDRATGGWTAAAVLAVARAKRTGESLRSVADTAGRRGVAGSPVAAILDEALVGLTGIELAQLAQVARLPMVDSSTVAAALGDEGFFERALAAGVPLTQRADGWWELPGPVQDHLTSLASADPGVLEKAAYEYRRRGELSAALRLLLTFGFPAAAAELLATAPPAEIEKLDVLDIESVVARLPEEVISAHPTVLVHLARHFMSASLIHQRDRTLARVERIAGKGRDPILDRVIAAERAKDHVRDGQFAEAEQTAAWVLRTADEQETLTRAGALSALGRALCRRHDAEGRRDLTAVAEADRHLGAASELYGQLGMPAAQALLVPYRAIWIDYNLGHAQSALRKLNEGLGLVVDRPRTWALLLIYRAEVEIELGLFDEHDATAAEALRVAEQMNDDLLRAYAYWDMSIAASHRGENDEMLECLRLTESHGGEWWSAASAEYLSSAADSLGRLGHTAMAWEYLDRAKKDPQDTAFLIAMSECVLLARSGDPTEAESALLAAPGRGVDPREYWRILLMRALAAFRRGDKSAGALASRAFEEAARLGLGHLPLTMERAITEELLGLAVETGQPAALALEAAALPTAVSVLGRFSVTSGGRPVPVGPGQGAQVLKMLAVSQGRLVTERIIDALWPEADVDAGRNRLRTVLNRLRSEIGDVILREGETLTLRADARVDLTQFDLDARRALALGLEEPTGSVALARSAIARYRGDVLPDDPYEDWTALPRERARRTMLQLLDLCADAASMRGDLDEMRRVVELTIDLAPYEDERYLRAASVLLEQGRRGAALTVVRRARSALAELGLEPPRSLAGLERRIIS